MHGPATNINRSVTSFYFGGKVSVDQVLHVWCPVWPPAAADRPTRCKKYGWPDGPATDRIVGSGFNVVQVAHRRCKAHEWLGRHQWRLSFPRAEIVQFNSWAPVQQIVYHMLRFFVKTERLSELADNDGDKLISNYNIKTAMLWVVERKPSNWWINNLILVATCRKLRRVLAIFLNAERQKHYFIPQCNIIVWGEYLITQKS